MTLSGYEDMHLLIKLKASQDKTRVANKRLKTVMSTLQGLVEDDLNHLQIIEKLEELCSKYPERL